MKAHHLPTRFPKLNNISKCLNGKETLIGPNIAITGLELNCLQGKEKKKKKTQLYNDFHLVPSVTIFSLLPSPLPKNLQLKVTGVKGDVLCPNCCVAHNLGTGSNIIHKHDLKHKMLLSTLNYIRSQKLL